MKTIQQKLLQGFSRFLILFILFILITLFSATFIIQLSGDPSFEYQAKDPLIVNDITALNPIHVAKVIKPEVTEQIASAIIQSSGPISIGGGRYSMGGQVAFENSLHIDMRSFNKILNFDKTNKTITVQTGITWRDIQQYIDPFELSIRIMQTYSNFTVGGSLSVNVHGRYVGEGPLIKSVLSVKVILADGVEVTASRTQNSGVFYGVIGGYGGLGVITEATLNLADNEKIARKTTAMKVSDYASHFSKNIRDNQDIIFHNADLYPPNYDEVVDISWYKTDLPLTITDRLREKHADYSWESHAAEFVGNYDLGKAIRKSIIDPLLYSSDRVVWRNWEASYDVRELEPQSRAKTTYVLREYFIPVENFDAFVPVMKEIFTRNNANIINVSIRHAHQAPENLLSWARNEVFAFVVYYQQGTDQNSKNDVKKWSLEIIDAVIANNGAYYLPYQILATNEQFHLAYPRANEFFALKAKLDPDNRFINQLWKKYYPQNITPISTKKASIKNYYRAEEQTILTIPEWYLVFNPLEYAQFLEQGNNPSDFPFIESIKEYWTLYDRAVAASAHYNVDNSEYMTMLQVIGISTTVEYMYKSLYENTIGRFTRWTANDKNTPEDNIITQAHRAYSDLIYDQAWYMFDFSAWLNNIWQDTDFFGDNFIRKTERKLFFTVEFGFKALYAKLIAYASQVTYEHGDGRIYFVASAPMSTPSSTQISIENTITETLPKDVQLLAYDGEQVLLSVPRWGPFTETMPKLLAQGFKIQDISGNHNIAISYLYPSNNDESLPFSTILFDSALVSEKNTSRKVVMVEVGRLSELLLALSQHGFILEHIYDY